MDKFLARFCKALALLLLLRAAPIAAAQGCATCYTQAAGAGSRMIQGLRGGIVMLIVPPMLFCVGISWVAYKKRNQFDDETNDSHPTDTLQKNRPLQL